LQTSSSWGQRSVDLDVTRWTIYPNPVSDQLTLAFDGLIESGNIMVTDNLGRCVESYVIDNGTEIVLDVSGFDDGMYYIRVHSDESLVYIDKFMVN